MYFPLNSVRIVTQILPQFQIHLITEFASLANGFAPFLPPLCLTDEFAYFVLMKPSKHLID